MDDNQKNIFNTKISQFPNLKDRETLLQNANKIANYYNNYIANILIEQQTFLRNLSVYKSGEEITNLINGKYEELKKSNNFEQLSNFYPYYQEQQAAPAQAQQAQAAPAQAQQAQQAQQAAPAQAQQVAQAPAEIPPAPIVGGRRNKSKHTDISMKYIKSLCKANQIKLSTTINDKRVTYTKKELITKLKRKKLL
jgi:pyruvate/2-oxoglutarate dehydrogenase complex dihydrolipoamide acyltransferase (E2) component